jgi:hypothetical protein
VCHRTHPISLRTGYAIRATRDATRGLEDELAGVGGRDSVIAYSLEALREPVSDLTSGSSSSERDCRCRESNPSRLKHLRIYLTC